MLRLTQGPHAQYTVHLESVYPPGVHNAFFVAPEVGYQRQSFFLSTQNHHMLDYDNTEIDYKKIQIRVCRLFYRGINYV